MSILYINEITALFILSAITTLACFIFYSKKELNRSQMIARKIIHLLFVLIAIFFTAIYMEWIRIGESVQIIVFVVLVVAVYIIVYAVELCQSRKLADRLNHKLKERYRG